MKDPEDVAEEGSLRTSCARCGRLIAQDRSLATHSHCPGCEGSDAYGKRGCPSLAHPAIDASVVRGVPGTYALGYLDGGEFVAFYVGRADSDLNARLHDWVGVDAGRCDHGRGAAAPHSARHRSGFPPSDTPVMRSIGPAVAGHYTHFSFAYALSSRAAYEGECTSYHALGEDRLDNPHHPVPPEGTDWKCPHARSRP
ncbi:MAG: hypothetical protein R3263_11605 [Myxococcota bacterium]|nr:hypothetical protein [Myxococcota bacterium]